MRKWLLENLQCKYSEKGQNVPFSVYLNLNLSASFRYTVSYAKKRPWNTFRQVAKICPNRRHIFQNKLQNT